MDALPQVSSWAKVKVKYCLNAFAPLALFFFPHHSFAAAHFQVDTDGTLTTGLVSYWKLDGSPNDYYGTNSGTDVGGVTYSTTTEKVNEAANFNGSSYISIPDDSSLSPSSVSVSLWVDFTSGLGNQALLDKRDNLTGSAGWQLGYFQSKVSWSSLNAEQQWPYTFSTNTWYNIVVTQTGTTANTYVDGSQLTGSGTMTAISNYASPLLFGIQRNITSSMKINPSSIVFLITILAIGIIVASILFYVHSSIPATNSVVLNSTTTNQDINPLSSSSTPATSQPIWGEYHVSLPDQLILVDAQGRRTGEDPATGIIYREIPDTSYSDAGTAGELFTTNLPSGRYAMYVLGGATGSYWFQAEHYGQAAQTFRGTVQKGSMIAYVQNYDTANIGSSTFSVSSTVSSTASLTTTTPNNWTPAAP